MGSASSLLRTSSTLVPMWVEFSNEDSIWPSSVRKLPSQFNRKLSAALNTVSVLSSGSGPSGVVVFRPPSAPLVWTSWQDEQANAPSWDKRRSWKSCSPSATFRGSEAGGGGIGVMGSWSVAGATPKVGTFCVWARVVLATANSTTLSHAHRRRDGRLAGVASLAPTMRDADRRRVSESELSSMIVSFVLSGMAHGVFDLTTGDSEVVQCSIIESLQSPDHRSLLLLLARARPEPEQGGGNFWAPGSRAISSYLRPREFLRSRGTGLEKLLLKGWRHRMTYSRVVFKAEKHLARLRFVFRIRMRHAMRAVPLFRADVDSFAGLDKAWVQCVAIGSQTLNDEFLQPVQQPARRTMRNAIIGARWWRRALVGARPANGRPCIGRSTVHPEIGRRVWQPLQVGGGKR